MEIKQSTIDRLFKEAAVTDTLERLNKEGFKVEKYTLFHGHDVDLIAKNQDRKLIYIFKTGKIEGEEKESILELAEKARKDNYLLKIITVPLPKRKSIEVDGIEDTLLESFLNELPSDLDPLSMQTIVNDIADVTIDKIEIKGNGDIFISGTGTVYVDLDYHDEDLEIYEDSYPFKFSGCWTMNEGSLKLEELESVEVDTSSFYQ